MVKVPPDSSSGVSLRARARAVRSRASRAISVRVLRPASRMTGTMSPSSMATATPMLTWRCRRMRVSSHEALTSGCAASAVAQARMSRSVTVILTSAPRRSLAWARNASSLSGGGHDGQVEVRDLAGAGGQPLRGEAAHRGQRDLLGVTAAGVPRIAYRRNR